jgi:EAL domain-containing protein (putative c-di-GMP-specific phosphodiesterase class I)
VALKKHGIRASLDDFGTGFSSLILLRLLPLDAMKIDKSFIDDLESNQEAMHMVAEIVELAEGLRIEVIAEGVENEQQLLLLRAMGWMGCHYAQGYHIHRPLIAAEAIQFVGQWTPGELAGPDERADALKSRLVRRPPG